MELGKKQIQSLNDSNAKINIWEGAVRAGKTHVSIWRFIKEIKYGPKGDFVIICKSIDTFKRNVLQIFYKIIGSDAKWHSGKRELHVWGRVCHVIGASDERAESRIRGPTFMAAYVDEASQIPESAWKMLVSRCAMGEAKIFATTNPDNPFHHLNQEFLHNNSDVKSWKFFLEDNPILTEKERDYLKRQYKGLWYKRFIQADWCMAEGAVFPFFSETYHVIKKPPGYAKGSFVGVDIGYSNPTSFVLISYNDETSPKLWVEDVYYHQSKDGDELSGSDYAEALSKFIYGRNVQFIYIDPAAAAFKMDLKKVNLYGTPVRDADNDVEEGIKALSSYIADGDLKICLSCRPLIEEIQGYVWNPKASEHGEDKPLKKRDHAIDALRYAVYSYFGNKPTIKMPSDTDLSGKTLGNPKSHLMPQNPYNSQRMEKFDWNDRRNVQNFKREFGF